MLNDPIVPDRKCRTPFYGLASREKSRTPFYSLAGIVKTRCPVYALANGKYRCYIHVYICSTGRPGPQSTAWHGTVTGTMW